MGSKEKFDRPAEIITNFYSKEFLAHSQAIEDSLTAEQRLEAAEMRIDQLQNLNDKLARANDGLRHDLHSLAEQKLDELDSVRSALRLVIRRQIGEIGCEE